MTTHNPSPPLILRSGSGTGLSWLNNTGFHRLTELFFTLFISLRRTLSAVPKGVCFGESSLSSQFCSVACCYGDTVSWKIPTAFLLWTYKPPVFFFDHDKSHYGSLFWFFIFPEGGTEQALISQNVFYVVKECPTLLFTILFSSMHAVMEIHWDGKYLQPFLGIHPTLCLILPHISKRILRWQGIFVETVIASGHGK